MEKVIISGTDTDIGKTIFSAALMTALEAAGKRPHYWKPIQAGIEDVDTRAVQHYTQLPEERFLPEDYILSEPLSPHRAAEIDGVNIDVRALRNRAHIPQVKGHLIIEGAGGLMVPISRENLQINLYRDWNIPVILCTRTALGTLNHTLLSLEALWARNIPVMGIVFIGEENADNMRTIAEFSGEKILGRMPQMDHIDDVSLRLMFGNHFDIRDFT